MKIPILALTTNSNTLKQEFLRCFGLHLSNSTTLHGVVKDLISAGVSRKTLTIWAVEAGYAKASVSSLLSRIYSSLGLRDRRKGAGRKPSSAALELLAHAHDRYGESFLKVLRAAWRAGKARSATSTVSDANSDVIVVPQLREVEVSPQFYNQPLQLSYFDGINSVVHTEVTNSVGLMVENNQLVYPYSFCVLKTDCVYTYTKYGFEQDFILLPQPPAAESYRLNPETMQIQMVTEDFNSPNLTATTTTFPAISGSENSEKESNLFT